MQLPVAFSWDFTVKNNDIGFQAYFEHEGEESQFPVLVQKWQRHSSWVRGGGVSAVDPGLGTRCLHPPPPLCADGSPRAPFPPSALLARNQAQVGRVLGNYTADGPGVLIICWDNTYSVLTSKTISYRVTKEPRL